MLRMLAVSMWMPPTLTARAVQAARLLKAAQAEGWASTVVTHDAITYRPLQYLDWDLARVYADSLASHEAVSLDADPPPVVPPKRRWLGLRTAPPPVPVAKPPEEPILARWKRRAADAALGLARGHAYSALVTFAHPWEDHEVGLDLAAVTGLPWLAHFADPWVDNPYFAAYDPKVMENWRRLEAQVAERADALVFVSDKTRELVMSKYPPSWSERAYVLPHCFDSELIAALPNLPPRGRRMRIVHPGNFYGHRTAVPVMDALSRLSRSDIAADLDIRLIGIAEPDIRFKIAELGLEDMVTIVGQRPYRETLFDVACADLALVVDGDLSNSGFLPSKLVDSIGMQRPVLGVSPEDSVTATLLRRLECPVVPPGEPAALAAAIAELHGRWKRGELAVGPAYRRVATEFETAQVARKFALILRQAIITRQARH